MRSVLLALMIVMLPLRGWVGDVMAMEKLPQAGRSTQAAGAAHEHHHEAQPCHGHADAGSKTDPAGHDKDPAAGDCGSCTVCQICHSVALAGLPPLPGATAPAAALPQTHQRLHASAERAPGFKPPIS